jgi:hypothetical protein
MGLVRPVLIRRLNNEIADLNGYLGLHIQPIPETAGFPIELRLGLSNTPGRASADTTVNEHMLVLVISGEYPYERPRAKWLTPIFHPNIMMPEDGGFVCVKMLDNWSFGSSLLSFVKSVEHLIADPNPMNPYGTGSCMAASKWYLENRPRFEASISYGGGRAQDNQFR